MNEEKNLQTAKRFYQAVNERDLPAILKLLTDDIDWKDAVAGKWQGSAWCHSLQEFERYGSKFFELLDIQRFEPEEFISGHDNLVVEGSARYVIRATGRLVKTSWVQIFIFRDGQICRFREYSDMAFWEASGAPEPPAAAGEKSPSH
jgi:ketosteroid isomerase-like protein